MKQSKLYYLAAAGILSLFLFFSGCAKKAVKIETLTKSNPNLKLALTKVPGQSESFRLKTLVQRKVSIEGPERENAMSFDGGQSSNKIEMVFDSLVQSVNDQGNAIEQITIKELKYFSEVRDEVTLDFDSSKDKNPNDALFALIGNSYTIEVTPQGQVAVIGDTSSIIGAIEDIPSNLRTALSLISESSIKSRHSIPLPDANDNELKAEKTWSSEVSYDFDRMGSSSFEKTYKLEKVEKNDDNLTAIISMSAIPSAASSTPTMADVMPTYTGSMELDITTGTLIKNQENLVNEWVIVVPNSNPEGPPNVIHLTATRLYDIEKIK
ncbi:MAG: hypothetical protein JXA96_06515 [Sedimentisphaerales bacterium]|nr:hypothetical protein [Sedimentisphaerales bacterium]